MALSLEPILELSVKHTLCLVLLSSALAAAAVQAKTCYDFSGQPADAVYPVDGVPVDIGIGQVRVRPLVLDGVTQGEGTERSLRLMPSQKIAGGTAPEMYGVNLSVQLLPREGVQQVTLRYAHQPGAEGARAAMVEVNGARREWRGAFNKLDGQQIGTGAHPARFDVQQASPGDRTGWVGGRMRVQSKDGIRSLTLGAAELRLDDVCFERTLVP